MDYAYALTGIGAVLHAAAFFAAAWGWGRVLTPRRLDAPDDRPLVEIAIGSGALGYAAFALGLAGWMRPAVLAAVVLAGIALLAVTHFAGRTAAVSISARSGDASRLLGWGAAAAAGAVLLFGVMGALLPEVEYDALWYHLTFPRRYLESGVLLDIPCDHMSPTPQHVELLYAYGLVFGDARTVKLIHLGFGLLAAAWAMILAARLAGRRWAIATGALFVTAPTVTWEMTTAYNELPLAFVATGAVALLLRWRHRPDRRLLLIAGVLLGIGMAGKHVALFFTAPLTLFVFLAPTPDHRRATGRRVLDATLLGGIAFLVALPWYVRAWALTGNPLFPMFYTPLTALGLEITRWSAQAEQGWSAAMARYGHGRSATDLLLLPFRATWDGVRYAGSFGPAWLLGLPLVPLVWRRLEGDARLVAALVAVFLLLWISPFSSFQLRYLVPAAPLVAVLLAAAGRGFTELLHDAEWRRAAVLVEAGVVIVLLLNHPLVTPAHDARTGWIATTMHSTNAGAWRTAIGAYDHERYLRERLESYSAVGPVNAHVPPDGRVVWFGEAAAFYARPELLMDFSRCVSEGTWGAEPGEEALAYRVLSEAGVTHIAWDLTRTDVSDTMFAVRSPEFRRRYSEQMYSDDVIVLDRLLPAPAAPEAP